MHHTGGRLMSSETKCDILDDLFHGAAFAAFVDESIEAKSLPCAERVKYRAYDYYEEALAIRNAS